MIALSFNNKCMSFNDKLMSYDAEPQSMYSAFKVLMSGVGQHSSIVPSNYVELSEIGMSWNDHVDQIGFNVVSTALSGTPWGNGNPDKLFDGSIGGAEDDKFDAYNFTAAEVQYTTTEKCIPSAYSFWSCQNQAVNGHIDYAAPNVYQFYGYNDETQQYDKLAEISSSELVLDQNRYMTHVVVNS